jgi:predicted dehydrogenase
VTLGVGLIGLSAERGWAAAAHVPALWAVPGVELVACSASTLDNARLAAAKHDVPVACADAVALAEHPDVDLVVVTVKVPHHAELVGHALAAGKRVLCEWPLGNGTAQAEAMAAAAAGGPGAWVGLQARACPALHLLADLIRAGEIGEVLSTTLVSVGEQWGPTVPAGNEYLLDPANGATMLSIPFGHAVDALTHILGEFTEISATMATRRTRVTAANGSPLAMATPDQIAVNGTLDNGAVASIHVRGGRTAGLRFHWEITGSDGEFVVVGKHGHLQFGLIEVFRSTDGRPLEPVWVPHEYEATPGDPSSLSYTVAQAYAGLVKDVNDGGHRTPTFADAVVRHRMLDAVERAAATGTRQRWVPSGGH